MDKTEREKAMHEVSQATSKAGDRPGILQLLRFVFAILSGDKRSSASSPLNVIPLGRVGTPCFLLRKNPVS